ncbi:MAG: TRAP transporter small permease [Rhodocyclaceae bacterium]
MKRLLDSAGDWAAKLVTVLIVAITVIAVFMRYALNDPLQWVEEVLVSLFVWMIMLGAASAMRVRGHVSIDAITGLLPAGGQRAVRIFTDLLSIVILVTLGWLGLELTLDAGDKITPILGLSYSYIDMAMPVGCFWMALYGLFHLHTDLFHPDTVVTDNLPGGH